MRTSPLLLVVALAACAPHPPPHARVPAPAPAPAGPSAGAAPRAAEEYHGLCSPEAGCVLACVVHEGRLEAVDMIYNPATGDSTHRGRRFSEVFPLDSTYAANAAWYRRSEPIRVLGKPYVKYGPEIFLGTTDVVPVATFRGVAVFAEPGANLGSPDVIYVPVRPGCRFQPYNHGEVSGGRP